MSDQSGQPGEPLQELRGLVQRTAARQLPFDMPSEIDPVVEEIVELLRPLVRSRSNLDQLSRVLPNLLRKVECWSDDTPVGYLHDYDTSDLRACILGCDTVDALAARLA